MIALWIALAAVFVVLLVGAATIAPARRRARRQHSAPGPDGARESPPRTSTAVLERPSEDATEAAERDVETLDAPAPAPLEAPPAPVEALPEPLELRDRLGKTRGLFSGYLRSLRSRGSVDEAAWEDLEEALLRADVGVVTTTSLIDDLRSRVRSGELRGPDAVLDALRIDMRRALETTNGAHSAGDADGRETRESGAEPDGAERTEEESTDPVEVWLFVGVNGVGKTTTIGKVARRQVAEGRSVLLAAGDTFRAAAAEQLGTWAERAGVEIVSGAEGADPSAVVFDAVRRAAARGCDLVLADTAGRLHTKVNLIEELKKIRRVAARPPGQVTEVLLVLDATTGQNGLTQARQFLEAVSVTGVVLTKLDGTAKGGIVLAIQSELGIPVKLVGIGEGADDLVPFDAGEFVAAIFE